MDYNYGKSIYHRQANTTQKWCPIDSEENWKSHIRNPEKARTLYNLGWTEENITYTFNSHGFRADEFEGDGIIFLGCSLTAGIGMDLERTWTHKISTTLGLKNWNLGQGGGANDTCFRLGSYWIPTIQPKMVCMFSPSKYRLEIVKPHQSDTFLPNSQRSLKHDLYRDWLSTDINGKLNASKNISGLKILCQEFGIPFHCLSVDEPMANGGTPHENDYGRDLVHPGHLWNNDVANKFLGIINEI